jgi:hypothetical protein
MHIRPTSNRKPYQVYTDLEHEAAALKARTGYDLAARHPEVKKDAANPPKKTTKPFRKGW